MRSVLLLPLIPAVAPLVSAITLHKRDVPAVVELPLERRQSAEPLSKRDSPVNVSITNEGQTGYLLNLTLGNPAQTFSLGLDTGSSDLWVNVANSTKCSASDDPCKPFGLYNASASSDYKPVNASFNATYAGGDNAYGSYATDTLGLGSTKIKDFQFIVAESSTDNQGIAGIGYKISTYEAAHENKEYDNLPYALVTSGATKSAAYSLWLNDVRSSTGTILFGGVNKAKYHGELQTLPIVPVYNDYYSLAIALTGVSVQTSSSSKSYTDNLPLAVSLDTGTSFTALPESLVNKIYKDLDVTYVEKSNAAYIDCDATDKDYNVTYSFSGAEITVGISELVLDFQQPGFPTGTCAFGLVPSQPGVNLLGDTFLRSAYVVYDLENNEISLANTNFNPGDDDILEIGIGTSAVPGATLVPSAVSTATGNGVAETGSNTGSTIPATITSAGDSTVTAGATSAPVSTSGSPLTSSTSSALAAMRTTNAKQLLSGLAGAGILLIV
ncbi:aspartic-type endopeptidase (OpsB), putative [Talaromyces islandicus]|uniref:Aspartic-type endopeptidase (OpsB), putative n=1 Tax=Talaromyces islandicus TaxID=28573 RepID=A0A0U1LK19_TALIS|nr:aspartic-type endopeptidase (OpsB), putative [Talaromyces islandicus]